MRIIAFILMCTLGFTNLVLVRRLPPHKHTGPFINLQAFSNPAYSTYCAAGFVTFLGLYTVRCVTCRLLRIMLIFYPGPDVH